MRLLVTGCAGSGTGFMAALLRRCGVNCGHEQVFTNDGAIDWGEFQAESSWLAVDRLSKLDSSVRVVHLVRHPLRVARSCVRFFDVEDAQIGDESPEWRKQRDVARKFLPAIFEAGTPIERFCRYWSLWNGEIQKHVAWRLRIEDLLPENVVELCRVVGKSISRDDAADALWDTPNNTNSHSYRDPSIALQDVRSLAELAEAYGYKFDEV